MAIYKWDDDITVHTEMDKTEENRYLLKALWNGALPNVTFIMLNPSVGRTKNADATLIRCLKFAKSWGYGSMDIVNLYSQIEPKPKNLRRPTEEEILRNNDYIKQTIKNSDVVVFGWGEQKASHKSRINEVINLVPKDKQYCIDKTKDKKFPRHPLYLKKDLPLMSWNE